MPTRQQLNFINENWIIIYIIAFTLLHSPAAAATITIYVMWAHKVFSLLYWYDDK